MALVCWIRSQQIFIKSQTTVHGGQQIIICLHLIRHLNEKKQQVLEENDLNMIAII